MAIPYFQLINSVTCAANIDGKIVGNTLLADTSPSDIAQIFVPTHVIILTRDVDTVSIPPTVSVGSNSPTYNNYLPATLLSVLTTWPRSSILKVADNAPGIFAGGTVNVRVSIGATATAWRFNVYLVCLQLSFLGT
jgi:hypothetical protein